MVQFGLNAAARRITGGTGYVRRRTLEFGSTVIAVANIGSIRFSAGEKNWGLAFVGAVLALIGLFQLDTGIIAWMFLLIGIGLIIANVMIKAELSLSIGTCDGRVTEIVSTDREFLIKVLDFIQRKIDEDGADITASIDLGSRSISAAKE